jgi:hypothetical protein
MSKKRKAKAAEPKCAICAETMELKKVIPKAHIFPELRTYQCTACGNLRTVEDESGLVVADPNQLARPHNYQRPIFIRTFPEYRCTYALLNYPHDEPSTDRRIRRAPRDVWCRERWEADADTC